MLSPFKRTRGGPTGEVLSEHFFLAARRGPSNIKRTSPQVVPIILVVLQLEKHPVANHTN
jgi:hypothetical protein